MLLVAVGLVQYLSTSDFTALGWGISLTHFAIVLWTREVAREGTLLGFHTTAVGRGLLLGFALFVLSEVLFFVSWFWAYLDGAISPSIASGSV